MSRDRFVVSGVKRIEISDGDWIDVKTGLTAGEQRQQDSFAIVPHRLDDGTVVDRVDWSMYEFLRTDLWIKDWSLTKTIEGKVTPIPKSISALQALDPDDFNEINKAVYAHILEWLAGKAARAKERTLAEPKSAQT
jgi:hypothetical protein